MSTTTPDQPNQPPAKKEVTVTRHDLFVCWGWALEAMTSLPRYQLPDTKNLRHVEDAMNRVYDILIESQK